MDFNRAVERYRDRAGDSFVWPAFHRSEERGGRWYLRNQSGDPIAIVDKSGRVLCNGASGIISIGHIGD